MSVSDRNQIKYLFEKIYADNARAGDPQHYATMFTKEALQMPPNLPDRYGQADIAAGYAAQITNIDLDPTLTVEDIQVMGEFGYVIGIAKVKVSPKDGSPAKRLKFRGLWLVKKEQEVWKIDRQIWNEKPQ